MEFACGTDAPRPPAPGDDWQRERRGAPLPARHNTRRRSTMSRGYRTQPRQCVAQGLGHSTFVAPSCGQHTIDRTSPVPTGVHFWRPTGPRTSGVVGTWAKSFCEPGIIQVAGTNRASWSSAEAALGIQVIDDDRGQREIAPPCHQKSRPETQRSRAPWSRQPDDRV